MFLVRDIVLLSSSKLKSPGAKLRNLINNDHSLIVPGVSSPIVAMIAQQIGFDSLYISGAATSTNLGLPDVGLITMSEVLDLSSSIINNVSLPLIVDVDTGFGDVVNVSRTVKSFEQIGVAGVQLEDQVLPKKCGHLDGKQLVSPEEMAEMAMNKIMVVSQDAPPVIKDQAIQHREKLKEVLLFYMKKMAQSERSTIWALLKQQVHEEMAEIIRRV